MILSNKCIIPPKEWYHNPNISDEASETVAMILA